MEDLHNALSESAKVLGVSVTSDVFRSALALGSEALDSGLTVEASVEIARRVLLSAVPTATAA